MIYQVLTMGFLAFAIASGTKVAKAADTIVNCLFSKQTEIVYKDEIRILDDEELQEYYFSDHYIDFDDTELMQKIENGEAEPFLFTSEQNVTYKLVSEDNTVEILQDSTNAEIEPHNTFILGKVKILQSIKNIPMVLAKQLCMLQNIALTAVIL